MAAFDPATARRVFTLSGGDYVLSTIAPGLIAAVRGGAPNVDLRFRFVEKTQIEKLLDEGVIDLALGVFPNPAKRFEMRQIFEEHFVCVARRDHPVFQGGLDLAGYAAAPHLLVTERGDDFGAVDEALARVGLTRRIALTVPSVLAVRRLLLGSDLIATIGERVAGGFAQEPRLALAATPLALPPWKLSLLSRRGPQPDAGLTWLIGLILRTGAALAVAA